ncbi:MAG TPA: DUF4339 domain-containing protein, partial [Cellvibrionaceae bacterium]|nr:DUF4339 domain-containing protein [Cellvibrionaceae bacterium]
MLERKVKSVEQHLRYAFQKISKETPIWYEGLPEWTKAGEIPELSELFRNSTPPPINPNSFSKNESSKPIPPKSHPQTPSISARR